MECFYSGYHSGQLSFYTMRTAYSTSRVTYPVTTLALIKAKREALHQQFIQNATKDLREAYVAEKSRLGIKFHVNYVWA